MIEKMKFLSISGPKTDIDRITEQYLSKYEIQLENAITELKTTENLIPFMEVNPYKEALNQANQYCKLLKNTDKQEMEIPDSDQEAFDLMKEVNRRYQQLKEEQQKCKQEKHTLKEQIHLLEPFQTLDVDLQEASSFQYIRVRFGRISLDYYHKLEKYLYDDLNAVFFESKRDEGYIYGCYYVAAKESGKIDSIFKSLHFEYVQIPKEYEGKPAFILRDAKKKLKKINTRLADLKDQMKKYLSVCSSKLLGTRYYLEEKCNNFDVRKYAAIIDNEQEDYYILCGWMSKKDTKSFIQETNSDDNITIIVENEKDGAFGTPPTRMKNPRFFKPFEMFIRMYGLPAHNEIDPTMFVALSYTFIFGAMFGDVGQGLCLFIGGGLLYLIKKMNLAGIISVAGIFSTFFGFLYGSFFGFEGSPLKPLWISPMKAMMKLPFVGQLNTVFIVAVAFGMMLTMVAMIFQIINAWKRGDKENIFFSPNGVAGLIFYGSLVLTIVLYMSGHKTPGTIMLLVFLGIPVLTFLLKEPLGCVAEGKKPVIQGGKGMFLVQGIFELIETMLSYFSNTLSFVRVGAFAVSHAAMMEVVLMLGGISNGAGTPNWTVIVLGNIFVCGMEGLIVGIQVLRLEYYEMFSRFYSGSGREFVPFRNHKEVSSR